MKQKLSPKQCEELFNTLKTRFEKNMHRHKGIKWETVQSKLEKSSEKLWSLNQMEITGGEPDVVHENKSSQIIFYDCASESPKERRSFCYDHEALESRKEYKPKNSALGMAAQMGIEVLTEENYRFLQSFEKFDSKTSSWIKTPKSIRELGGALFCDFRYGQVFTYHNGAESYYAVRGFRGMLCI